MKSFARYSVFGLFVLSGLVLIMFYAFNEAIPEGRSQENEADQLARKMLLAVNKPAYDSTRYISWNFAGRHQYYLDKEARRALVCWKKNEVLLNLDSLHRSKSFKDGEEVWGEQSNKLIEDAWGYYCNDSFWLLAPFKVFDPGTERSVVIDKEGNQSLMVKYSSGGVTPGDSYLWSFDESGKPSSFKMWVSIIPIGGFKASWEGWEQQPAGFWLSSKHDLGIINLKISDIKSGDYPENIGITADKLQ